LKQLAYNEEHNITPTQIKKSIEAIMGQTAVADSKKKEPKPYVEKDEVSAAADPVLNYLSDEQIEASIRDKRKSIESAVKELDFMEAARLRDEMYAMEELLSNRKAEHDQH
jgi:excinuclease ABC subunit B